MKNPNRNNVDKILIIYSKNNGKIRRIIDADNNHEYEIYKNNIHQGENYIFIKHEDYDGKSPNELQEYVSKKINYKIPELHETRHAHIDENGKVINIIEADLSCGDSPEHLGENHKLIQHPYAKIGWKYINGDFVE